MNRRTVGLSVHNHLTPVRWLRMAAAFADQEFAKLCSDRWRGGVPVPVAIPAVRRSRAR